MSKRTHSILNQNENVIVKRVKNDVDDLNAIDSINDHTNELSNDVNLDLIKNIETDKIDTCNDLLTTNEPSINNDNNLPKPNSLNKISSSQEITLTDSNPFNIISCMSSSNDTITFYERVESDTLDECNKINKSNDTHNPNGENISENIKNIHDDKRIQEVTQNSNTQSKEKNKDINNVTDQSKTDVNNSSNQPTSRIIRQTCFYYRRCFRKNPIHKMEYAHPGDDDYVSDKDDPRKPCKFGTKCYRKSNEHLKAYKHSSQRIRKKIPNIQTNIADDSEDDYDLEDSFFSDLSSDNYTPSPSPSDSDSTSDTIPSSDNDTINNFGDE